MTSNVGSLPLAKLERVTRLLYEYVKFQRESHSVELQSSFLFGHPYLIPLTIQTDFREKHIILHFMLSKRNKSQSQQIFTITYNR